MPSEAWGAVITVVVSIVGASWWFSWRLGVAMTEFKMIGTQQAAETSSLKIAVEKIEVTLSAIAVDRERVDGMRRQYDDRFRMIDGLIADLRRDMNDYRRGRGLIRNDSSDNVSPA